MSSITLNLTLTFSDPEHTRLVFEAFSQWPTNTVRKKTPNERRMRAIKCSMEWMGYQLPTIYQHVFKEKTCTLEEPPEREELSVHLQFYCGKIAGLLLFDAFFDEFTALPVTIKGRMYSDMTGTCVVRTSQIVDESD